MSLLTYLAACLAATMVGMSKTGVPGVSLPAVVLMGLAFTGQEKFSVGALLPILLVGDVFAIGYYRQHTQWQHLLRLFPYVLCGMIPGVLALGILKHAQFKAMLGAFVLALLIWELLRKKSTGSANHPKPIVVLLGFLAGFGTAMGNAAGPVMAIYLMGCGLPKEQFMGTWAWFFFCVNAIKLPAYFAIGVITPETLLCDLYILPGILAGVILGRRLFLLVPQTVFDVLVTLLAAAAALHLVLGAVISA